jgi:hypothetical protein
VLPDERWFVPVPVVRLCSNMSSWSSVVPDGVACAPVAVLPVVPCTVPLVEPCTVPLLMSREPFTTKPDPLIVLPAGRGSWSVRALADGVSVVLAGLRVTTGGLSFTVAVGLVDAEIPATPGSTTPVLFDDAAVGEVLGAGVTLGALLGALRSGGVATGAVVGTWPLSATVPRATDAAARTNAWRVILILPFFLGRRCLADA